MNARVLMAAVALGASLAQGGELGARFEVGTGSVAVGWVQLSGPVGGVTLSGRGETDLLCGCLRRLVLGASRSWGSLAAAVEGVVLSTGRLDTSVTASEKGLWRTGFGLLSAQAGGKATVVDVLGGRFFTAAGWGFLRFDREPLWIEANVNTAWPGGALQAEGRVGLAGPAWVTLVGSASGVAVELGAEQGALSAQSYVSFAPRFQTITVGIAGAWARAQVRVTARASGSWAAGVNVTATAGPWRGAITTSFLPTGVDKVTAEVRYAFGP